MIDGNDNRLDDALFARLASAESPEIAAPSRLKARIYSALMREATESRQLLPLAASEAAGQCLCVFERFVHSLPLPAAMDRLNYCRFCHPRWMAESIEGAPVWWTGCPYSDFQRH
jgi:hypothetical protein